jgi:hypothetical protein
VATPMIDDIELKAVQWIRQETEQEFVEQRIAGLNGTLHQGLGRLSHRVTLCGKLLPDTAVDDLKKLQDKASAGAEVSFTADITTALSIDKVVIESFAAEQHIGPAGQYSYQITLAESPPLPPPAEVSSFGGLGDFGLGDLGFDAGALGDVLADVASQAGAITDAIDAATDAIQAVSALADLGNLAKIGNPIKPISDKVGELGKLGAPVSKLTSSIGELFS